MATPTADMETVTPREQEQIERANASGKSPVVFIHGLWLLPSSWDRWAELFEEAGYAAVTPSWPDDPETVAEARAHPERLREEDDRPGRRSHRKGDRAAGEEAGGHGPLDRRVARANDR